MKHELVEPDLGSISGRLSVWVSGASRPRVPKGSARGYALLHGSVRGYGRIRASGRVTDHPLTCTSCCQA